MDCDLSEVPIRALSLSTRHRLSQYLNGEQYITTSDGLSRDYRGIAQMMGFSYAVMDSTLRTTDPLNALLQIYQNRSEATFDRFLQMLEQIERFDVIDDMTPSLIKDAKHYRKQKESNSSPVEEKQLSIGNQLAVISETLYDAYVCYADRDLHFVKKISEFLESSKIGFRLFIRDRDLCLGNWIYDSFAQVIEKQCRKVLIVLSPDFLECPECEFQTMFATGLAIEQRNRKLIPIIYEKCNLPPIIRMLTKIDMTRSTDANDWSWNRLVMSIDTNYANNPFGKRQTSREKPILLQLPSHSSNSSQESQLNSIETIDTSLHLVCPTPTAPPLISTQSSICSSINSEFSDKSDSECLPIVNSKKGNQKKWIQTLKQKFKI